MHHMCLRPLGIIFNRQLFHKNCLRKSEVSNENLPKNEGLNLPWQLQVAGEEFVLPPDQGRKSAKHGFPQQDILRAETTAFVLVSGSLLCARL